MSATQSWSMPVRTMPCVRFGTTRQPWFESVVAGTKARRRKHSKLSSRMRRSTRLWFTVADVADVLRPIWTGPGHSQGSRLRGILERIFASAKITEADNPATWDKLKEEGLNGDTVKAAPHPSLPYRDLPAFMVELSNIQTLRARALRFIILTGVRLTEALPADWSEFDLKAKLWTIPAERMKMREPHVVPPSDAAIACLGPQRTGLVFPSQRAGHIERSGVNKLLKKFRRIDPVQRKPITIPGFRSTCSTWAQDHGFPEPVIDLTLAHKERNRTRRAYLRSERIPECRTLLDQWAAFATSGGAKSPIAVSSSSD
jgi:integrase